jgi:hypothetical protein
VCLLCGGQIPRQRIILLRSGLVIDPTSAQWQRVDAILEQRHTRWGIAVGCGVAFSTWGAVREPTSLLGALSGATFFTFLIAADLWLWRRLRRSYLSAPDDPYPGTVFANGVFTWGVLLWLTMAIFFAYRSATEAHPFLSLRWVEAAAFDAMLSLPLTMATSLLVGYAWGRALAATFGIQRSSPRA